MSRAVPLSTSLLVGVCVFAWLAGPVLEARFGVEALLVVYAAVSAGTAATAYVLVRKIDVRLTSSSDSTSRRTSRAGSDQTASDGDDETSGTVTVSLDNLEDLDVEREVRQLKAERSEGPDED
ncbi:hypothetical protein C471_04865 [Halorubrum saccharovorum DSM 1137]|uniref:Uncharacterized protein n=1 Tax=Halorubrum saccharovorum DSM 1137 TaxID=1227484 RepID=M0E5Z9_9EURY|nr:hypothetical protein [Halorubrum saccharovorum]ELZ42342.1 hypothetical protein C471_04865 [Halorubrum saccharovorum DSM 1137]